MVGGGGGPYPNPPSPNSIVEVPSQKIAYLDNNGVVSTLARISSGRVKHITKQWLTAWLPGCSAAWTAVRGLRGRLELVATLLFVRRGGGAVGWGCKREGASSSRSSSPREAASLIPTVTVIPASKRVACDVIPSHRRQRRQEEEAAAPTRMAS